jgi:hypothetical protein
MINSQPTVTSMLCLDRGYPDTTAYSVACGQQCTVSPPRRVADGRMDCEGSHSVLSTTA